MLTHSNSSEVPKYLSSFTSFIDAIYLYAMNRLSEAWPDGTRRKWSLLRSDSCCLRKLVYTTVGSPHKREMNGGLAWNSDLF